ncbi:MAG: DegT/DnrJ/EryC1/StrS family aminotransferase [Bacteroidota bacterium]|nr:DegT/DnrJ/EryC1/StrS family aminotransferase [Bacteroidota bacterium]
MKKIQMVDLKSQYEQIKTQILTGFEEVLEEASFINGPKVHAFQKELEQYLGVKHVIPCANGTDALQIAMMGLGLKPGDEVITANFTFAATVEVIALLGLTPVLVDVDLDTFNISVEKIKKAITPKTRAIVPVHLFGQVADMELIMQVAKEHNLFVIEDNAQTIGAEYQFSDGQVKKAGTIGHVAATSFFPSKNLGCYGDGGAIFTNDDQLAHTIRGIVNHGMYQRYHHDVVGVNSRLDSLQAVVLQAKLPKLDHYNQNRREAAFKYSQELATCPEVIVPQIKATEPNSHVFHQYTLRVTNGKRNELMQYLLANDIPCAIYYPIALSKQKAYQNESYKDTDFPNTNLLVEQVLSLPMHSELDNQQIAYITEHIKAFFKKE